MRLHALVADRALDILNLDTMLVCNPRQLCELVEDVDACVLVVQIFKAVDEARHAAERRCVLGTMTFGPLTPQGVSTHLPHDLEGKPRSYVAVQRPFLDLLKLAVRLEPAACL